MASFMLARFKVASEEQFLYRKRGTYWSNKDESNELVHGSHAGERGSSTFMTDGYHRHSPASARGGSGRGGRNGSGAKVGGSAAAAAGEAAAGEAAAGGTAKASAQARGASLRGLDQWPLQGMTKKERARAVAEAAVLESQIKSSVWAVVGRHQNFLDAQEEHRMLQAVGPAARRARLDSQALAA